MSVFSDKDWELYKLLKDSYMAEQPGIKAHLDRAMRSGDFSKLWAYLRRHPRLLALARVNARFSTVAKDSNPYLPLPTRWEFEESLNGPIKIGFLDEASTMGWGLTKSDTNRHIAVAGGTGRGKTVLMTQMIRQIYEYRESLPPDQRFNIILMDTSKKEYRGIPNICPKFRVIPPEVLVLGVLAPHPFLNNHKHVDMFCDVFSRVMWGQILTRSILSDLHWELLQSNNLPTMENLLRFAQIDAKHNKTFGMGDVYSKLVGRLRFFVNSGCFDCVEGVPLRYFQQQDLIVELDGLDPAIQAFIVSYINRSLYLHNIVVGGTAGLRHVVVCEEARELLLTRDRQDFGDTAWDYDLTRVRGAGMAIVAITQEPSSLSNTTASNCFTKIAFSVNSGTDLRVIQEGWGLTEEQRDHIFKLKIGQAVVRYGGYPNPLLIHVPMLDIPRYVSDRDLEPRMRDFWDELKGHIKTSDQIARAKVIAPPKIDVDASFLLKVLSKNPFLNKSQLLAECDGFLSKQKLENAIAYLVIQDVLRHHEINVGGKRSANYYAILTGAGEIPGVKLAPGSGSYKHRLFQHLIKTWAEMRGAQAVLEATLSDNPLSRIDVLVTEVDGSLIANEVTISLRHCLENVRGDLLAQVDRVVIVVPDAQVKDRARFMVAGEPELAGQMDRIDFRIIWELRPSGT